MQNRTLLRTYDGQRQPEKQRVTSPSSKCAPSLSRHCSSQEEFRSFAISTRRNRVSRGKREEMRCTRLNVIRLKNPTQSVFLSYSFSSPYSSSILLDVCRCFSSTTRRKKKGNERAGTEKGNKFHKARWLSRVWRRFLSSMPLQKTFREMPRACYFYSDRCCETSARKLSRRDRVTNGM